MGWLRRVFDWNHEATPANGASTRTPPVAAGLEVPSAERAAHGDDAHALAWWEATDQIVELADRAVAVTGPAESELVRRVSERLNAGRYQLPVLPATLVRVIELGNKPDTTPREVAECIQSDAAVAGEVLGLVNSTAYMPASPIKDLQRAIVHVGVHRVHGLMLAVVARLTVARSTDAARAHPLWEHSLAAAMFAREIARAAAADPDEAFVAGLLHDVGKTVILGLIAEEERANKGTRVPEPLVEKLLEECHTGAGARIAHAWKLADPLRRAIEEHHGLRPHSPAIVAIVALANDVCGRLGVGVQKRRVDLSNHTAFPILGLDTAGARHLIARLPDALEESARDGGITRLGRGRGAAPTTDPPIPGGGSAALVSR